MATDQDRKQLRLQRLQSLEDAMKDYVTEERKRIEDEVALLEAVIENRRSGVGASGDATNTATKLAAADLAWFLRGV